MKSAKTSSMPWLAAILAVSVMLRIAVALYLGDVVDAPSLLTDQRSYHALGARLISGYGFSFDEAWYPFTPANTPTAHWSFLYSLFIASVYAVFGVHPLAARLVQAVVGGILLPWVVFRLARRVFRTESNPVQPEQRGTAKTSLAIAYASALIAAFYGYYILYAATLMTETFYIVGVLASLDLGLELASRLRQNGTVPLWTSLQLGLILGATALLRQSILPWLPVFFAYLLWVAIRNRRLFVALRTLTIAGLLLLACILPWTYRNYLVYGEFLLLNSNTGYAMYSAQHPMHGTHFREFEGAPMPEGLAWGNEAVMDRELMRIGVEYVLDDPLRYVQLSLSRVRAFFEFWPSPDTSLLHNVGRVGSYGVLLPFVLYGFYLTRYRSGPPSEDSQPGFGSGQAFYGRNALLLLFILTYTGIHLLTWAMVRYRLPVDATVMPWAGLALTSLFDRVRLGIAAKPGRRAAHPGRPG